MPWVRFDDGYLQSKKLRALGRDAFWLHFTAVFWSARIDNLTDGRIAKSGQEFEDFAAHALLKPAQVAKLAAVLVADGRFEDFGDHWLIHDYHEYQPTREEVLETREKRSAAGKRGADVRHGKSHGKGQSKSDGTVPDSLLGKTPAPCPESRVPFGSTNNKSGRLPSPGPVDNHDGLVDAVLEAIVQHQVETRKPRYPANYAASCRESVGDEYGIDASQAVLKFPGAPARSLAAHVLGESVPSLLQYRKDRPA